MWKYDNIYIFKQKVIKKKVEHIYDLETVDHTLNEQVIVQNIFFLFVSTFSYPEKNGLIKKVTELFMRNMASVLCIFLIVWQIFKKWL